AVFFDDFGGVKLAVAGVDDLHVVDTATALHFAVRRLDEAVVVDARKAGERADQTDVRTFRRFNRADAAVMGRVNVADFETSAFARETARSKRGEPALVGDFAKRVGLVQEQAKLRGAEEFADRGHDGL